MKTLLTLNGIEFVMSVGPEFYASTSETNRFVLGKSQEMIATLQKHVDGKPVRNIVDLGIYKGGSCVLYNELFSPAKLVAIDYQRDEVVALRTYIEARNAGERVKPYYRVDQSDLATMRRICESEFGGEPLDLVVDDASHLYEQTRASFNFLFPRVRPGGLYVIEDWAWSHWPGDRWQKPVGFFAGRTPLSILVFEIVMTCASMEEGAISAVHITGNSAYIERGYKALDDSFNISASYLSQGKPWGPTTVPLLDRIRQALWGRPPVTGQASAATGKPRERGRELTGLWGNPAQPGWNVYFSQRGGVLFAIWYTYDAAGRAKWYVMPNGLLLSTGAKESCTGSLYEASGPAFFGAEFDTRHVSVSAVGSMTLEFTDANTGSMTCNVADRTCTSPVVRHQMPAVPPRGADYTDHWWNPGEAGWGLAISHRRDTMFLVWSVYDAAGRPVWFVASDCVVDSSGSSCSGTLRAMTGPAAGVAFDPAQVRSSAAGTMRIDFSDADNGTLSYTVGKVTASKAITRQLF